jgi:hypothetical protein
LPGHEANSGELAAVRELDVEVFVARRERLFGDGLRSSRFAAARSADAQQNENKG